jgi:hypothetical protein
MGHPELTRAGNKGWDVVGGAVTTNPLSVAGEGAHATACAGIAIAEWGTVAGMVGIVPGASLFSLAIAASPPKADLVQAIGNAVSGIPLPNDASADHRRVIVLSGKLGSYSSAEQADIATAITNALAANVPVVVPTGDADTNSLQFPAKVPGVIAVGGLDTGNLRITALGRGHGTSPGATDWGSNYEAAGEFIVAPGTEIRTTDITVANGYGATNYVSDFQGTGAAAAHVAGLAALLLSRNPKLTADDVRSILYRKANKIGTYTFAASAGHDDGDWNDEVGYGCIDAVAAVNAAIKTKAKVEVIAGGSGTVVTLSDVPFRRTASATIRLHHNNSALTSPLKYTLPSLPAHWAYDAGTPASPVTVQSAALGGSGHVDITILFTAPSAVSTFSNTITFTHDAPLSGSLDVTLNAAVISTALDMVLVLDRSGSMGGNTAGGGTRAESVADAADLFISLCESDDALGIVRFDDRWRYTQDVLAPLTVMNSTNKGNLSTLITATSPSPIEPAGLTSIGGGMRLGMHVLRDYPLSTPRHNRAMVVMTDGHQNTGATLSEAHTDIDMDGADKPRVFALGVGLDTVDSEFAAIVDFSKGYKYQTGAIVGDTEVSELFTKIIADAAQADFAADPRVQLLPGQKHATLAPIGETEFQVDFIVIFPRAVGDWRRRNARIWLEAPNGDRIDASDIVAGTVANMTGRERPRHLLLRVVLPAFNAAPNAHVGTWKLWVQNGSKEASDNERQALVFAAMAMVKSDLRLQGHLIHPNRAPGEPIKIVAEPRLYRAPLELSDEPVASVTRPDGNIEQVTLSRNPLGQYVGKATDTGQVGTYSVDIEAQVTTPRGAQLARFLKLQTVVAMPGQETPSSDNETPADGLSGSGGARPGCARGLWCAFWRFFHCCDCNRKIL